MLRAYTCSLFVQDAVHYEAAIVADAGCKVHASVMDSKAFCVWTYVSSAWIALERLVNQRLAAGHPK
jgi:hypothetical protein